MGGKVLIDFKVGMDFCRPHSENYSVTVEVLRHLNDEDIQTDMREDCWKRINTSVTSELEMMDYLKNKATTLLSDFEPQTALEMYQEQVLTEQNLCSNGNTGIDLDRTYMPDVTELQEEIEQMGLPGFCSHANDILSLVPDLQRKLDLIVDQRFNPSAQDPWLFAASVEDVVKNDRQKDVLVDAYVWANNSENYLVSREDSYIISNKSDIRDRMTDVDLQIVSPVQISESLS